MFKPETLTLLIPVIATAIPIVAIVMGIGIGMLAIVLNHRKRREMFALYHQERMAAIDKGIELPPLPEAFFADDGRAPSPHRHLLKGLIWLFIGVGLLIALVAGHRGDSALFALVPAGIGLAYLIYYFAVGRKEAQALEAAQANSAAKPPVSRMIAGA
jgi:hypothetical protein